MDGTSASNLIIPTPDINLRWGRLESFRWDHTSRNLIPVEVILEHGCSLLSVRKGLESIPLGESTNHHHQLNVLITAYDLHRNLTLHMQVEKQGKRFKLQRTIEPEINISTIQTYDTQPAVLRKEKIFDVQNGKRYEYRVNRPPQQVSDEEMRIDFLLEGERVVKRLGKRPFKLPNLQGYGEALTVWRGIYNNDKPLQVMSDQVYDTGIIIGSPWSHYTTKNEFSLLL